MVNVVGDAQVEKLIGMATQMADGRPQAVGALLLAAMRILQDDLGVGAPVIFDQFCNEVVATVASDDGHGGPTHER